MIKSQARDRIVKGDHIKKQGRGIYRLSPSPGTHIAQQEHNTG
jgi:hypothetical protein